MDDNKLNDSKTIKFLKYLMSLSYNRNCADCGKYNPVWADVKFGFFICYECAGKHRSLGPNICKIKNTTMDVWSTDDLRRMYVGGNKYAYKLKSDLDILSKYQNNEDFINELNKKCDDSSNKEPGVNFMNVNKSEDTPSFGNRSFVKKSINRMGDKMKIVTSFEENNTVNNVKSVDGIKEENEKIEIIKPKIIPGNPKKKYSYKTDNDLHRSPFIFKPDNNDII